MTIKSGKIFFMGQDLLLKSEKEIHKNNKSEKQSSENKIRRKQHNQKQNIYHKNHQKHVF